jgi:predicted hydrocarbon binding protein
MNKREFLKTTCGLGLCTCAASIFGKAQLDQPASDPEKDKLKDQNMRLNWRVNHAKRQFSALMKMLETELDPSILKKNMEQLGRNCAKSLGWAEQHKGNPEGFFEYMKKQAGERLAFDETGKIITIVTPNRDCVCCLVDSSQMPGSYCDCSIGWQKETYETILGKPVEVDLKESVLRGSKRCVFEVRIV